jgi:GMP synthase-like glutamine amidotransferase
MGRPSILLIQNAEWEGPGLIGTQARAAGVNLVVRELYGRANRAGSLPFDELEAGAYSAVVSLGSPSTAYRPETNAHHEELVQLYKLVRRRKIPSFNVCYSMQLFSLVHGGRVVENPAGKEVGFLEVRPTRRGESDPVIGPIGPYRTLQWHGDIVDRLPQDAVHLAYSKKTENQMAVLDGIHYLLQADGQAAFPAMVRRWLKHDGKWATQGSGVSAPDIVREATDREAYFRNTFLRIFGNFLALVL